MFLICSASRICSFCLLFWCSNIVFSVRIFRNFVVGHEWFFNCCAMELVSERCIVNLLDRLVEVKSTYISLFSEIQSPKVHLNWYIIFIRSCRLHGYPRPSLATSTYRSSPPAGLQSYIPYPHIAVVCMFELVVLLLLGHMWGPIGVHHLWARRLLLQQCSACLVRLTLIAFVMRGRWPYSCRQDLFNITRSIYINLVMNKPQWLICYETLKPN